MENRNGLVVDAWLTEANGHAERIAALDMIEPRADRPTADHARRRQGLRRRGLRQRTALDERDAACGAEHQRPRSAIDGRTTRHAGYAVSQRIRKRIEEAFGWIKTVGGQAQDQVARPRARRLGLHLRRRRLQSGAAAEAAGGRGVKRPGELPTDRPLADRRGRPLGSRYLDLCGPATLTITAQGGEIAFGAMKASLELEYARDSIGFHWAGFDEGDEVYGEGTAELLDDGTIEIEFSYHNGDEAVLKAKRETSSTAC